MTVLLSPVGGAAAQFFDNNGTPLTGGKLYSYVAGTTTPQATYTSASGATAHTNPIILDSGGRVPGGEIWLTDGLQYKFVLKTSTDVLIGTYDNLVGVNSNFVNFLTDTEVQTATAGQTVFTLTTMQYQQGTNNLTVYVDGVNQIDGASYSYVETSPTVVTFTAGLHVGALVKFTTAQTLSTGVTDASLVTYTPAGTGAVATTAQTKLRESVSPEDFGAVGDGVADDSGAWNLALSYLVNGGALICKPGARYYFASQVTVIGSSRNKIAIFGYGARITTSGAISGLAITLANSASGGVTVFGLNIDHKNNAAATAGFDIYAAWYTKLFDCAVYAENNAATYAGVLVRNGNPANDATGSFWTQLDNFIAYGVSDDIPYGIILRGSSNATTIRGGALGGCITPIRLEPHIGQNTTPNAAVIDGVAFEVFTTAVSLYSDTGNDSIRGTRITNCRAENGATFVSLDGTNTSQSPAPLWLSGNYNISSVTTYLNNPNALYVNCWDFSITPVFNQQPKVVTPTPIRFQGTDTTKDVLELLTAGVGNHGLALLESDSSVLGWFRYVASGVLELAARASGVLLYLASVGGISATTTRANNLRGEKLFTGAATAAVTFGTAEVDANYYVTLGGKSNENFWVTNQSTTGFTINSSNATSTATCMWILVR